jgi:hypothetical protein
LCVSQKFNFYFDLCVLSIFGLSPPCRHQKEIVATKSGSAFSKSFRRVRPLASKRHSVRRYIAGVATLDRRKVLHSGQVVRAEPRRGDSPRQLHAFGLAAYAFTGSHAKAEALSRGLQAGMVGVNNFMIAHAEAPFGGIDYSGMGREGGRRAILDYLNVKLTHLTWA